MRRSARVRRTLLVRRRAWRTDLGHAYTEAAAGVRHRDDDHDAPEARVGDDDHHQVDHDDDVDELDFHDVDDQYDDDGCAPGRSDDGCAASSADDPAEAATVDNDTSGHDDGPAVHDHHNDEAPLTFTPAPVGDAFGAGALRRPRRTI
jgi:hypothetical protein